jgi:hypothetical protein
MSLPSIPYSHSTIVPRAKPKNRFAARLILFVNHNSRVKVSPIDIAIRKSGSYRLIWKLYGFK